jgi:CRISPR-associated exonuclease Cas4
MYAEDDLLPISALQHLAFCPRQCALIHLEQVWAENRLTAQGRVMHERVHEGGNESRGDVRIARGIRLRSLRLGLTGVADVVEFHRPDASGNPQSAIGHRQSPWLPFPVEYKRGKPKPDDCDAVQLCAQALCLEEMLNVAIADGALFYGTTRRRLDVSFDAALRERTERLAHALHDLFNARVTPPAVFEKRCENCSLIEECLPQTAGNRKSAARYLDRVLAEMTHS